MVARPPGHRGSGFSWSAAGPATAAVISLCACIAPPLLWLVRILGDSPNVPYTDEWAWADVLTQSRRGTIPWEALWQPHNGHRELVGGLLFLGLDRLGGWSVPREQLVCLLLAAGAVLIVFETARRVLDWRDTAIFTVLASILICGPLSYETILLGYNLGWQVCTLAFVAVVAVLTASRVTRTGLGAAALVALIGSFSSGQGLFVWPIGLALLVARRRSAPARAWAGWAGAGALVYLIYFRGAAGPAAATAAPPAAVPFLLTFLGVPLGWDGGSFLPVEIAGLVAGLAVLGCAAYAIGSHKRAGADAFIAYGAYAFLGALATALARGGMGLAQATSPRYSALAGFLPIALIGLVSYLARGAGRRRVAVSALVPLLAVALVVRVQSVMFDASTVYENARARELRGIAREDPAAAYDADVDPAVLLRLLGQLRDVGDGPLRYPRTAVR